MTDEQKRALTFVLGYIDSSEACAPYKWVLHDMLAAGASGGQTEPVAWRWRLTAEINGKQWGPGPWEYTINPEKFDNRTLYEVEPLFAAPPAPSVADARGICESCNGSGFADATGLHNCFKCNGSGATSVADAAGASELMRDYIELNPSNYSDDDVSALNAWGIRAFDFIEAIAKESGND